MYVYNVRISCFEHLGPWSSFFLYFYDGWELYMSHGTNILFNISLFKLSELSPSWVLNVTEILERLISALFLQLWYTLNTIQYLYCIHYTTVNIILCRAFLIQWEMQPHQLYSAPAVPSTEGFWWTSNLPTTLYGWNQPGREKAKNLGILPFTYWVLLTT